MAPLQDYLGTLQGNNFSFQGSNSSGLQNNYNPQVQSAPTPQAPNKVTYGNNAATTPKQQYVNTLKDNDPTATAAANESYFNSNPNIFGGSSAASSLTIPPPTTSTVAPTSPLDTARATYLSSLSGNSDALTSARTAYLSSLNPDPSVTAAKTKYLDFVNNAQSGINALEGQGRGIPLALVRGQQAKLGQQAELTANRLQDDVTLSTDNAKLAQDRAKAALGFAIDDNTDAQTKAKTALDFATTDAAGNKPVELSPGGTLVKLNPATGQYETVANGAPKAESLPASAQEYEYAVKNGYKGTYDQYQTEDANRKRSVTNIIAGSGLSSQQAGLFNQIVNKYQASPLIAGADKTAVLTDTINGIRKDPGNGALQLNLAYQYVKALDTYQSAVREGELGLVSSIDSKIGQLKNSVDQITNGQQVRPEVAKQIADAAETLVSSITSAAKQKAKAYQSQAQTLGLGDAWSTYTSGFTSPSNSSSSPSGTPDYGAKYGF